MAKEHTTKFEDRTETRFQWMMAFGVGTVLLGVGGVSFPFPFSFLFFCSTDAGTLDHHASILLQYFPRRSHAPSRTGCFWQVGKGPHVPN